MEAGTEVIHDTSLVPGIRLQALAIFGLSVHILSGQHAADDISLCTRTYNDNLFHNESFPPFFINLMEIIYDCQ